MAAPHDFLQLPTAERERAYSPSSCIGGDYRPFIAAYRERSALSRREAAAAGARWQRLRYGPAPAQGIEWCAPPPRSDGVRPGVLVFIHGGYWQELSAQDSQFSAAQCAQHGLAFAAIDYTLAPAATVPEIVAECRLALAWLATHAAALGIDADRIVIAGSSAGAHLAAMVALPPNAFAPRALVLVSGVYWLEPLVGTSINAALGLDVAGARRASPALAPLGGFPRALLAWGEIETEAFKSQSRAFADALAAAGTTCDSFEVPARNHFDVILDLADKRTVLGQRTLALFEAASPTPAQDGPP
jgi:arylformamidase